MAMMGWCQSGDHAGCPGTAHPRYYEKGKPIFEYPPIVCSCTCHAGTDH